VVEFCVSGESLFDFRDDGFGRKIFTPAEGTLVRRTHLTIDTIQCTHLLRNDIHAERQTKPS
jgi:hypothetical protein